MEKNDRIKRIEIRHHNALRDFMKFHKMNYVEMDNYTSNVINENFFYFKGYKRKKNMQGYELPIKNIFNFKEYHFVYD